ncbi:MAG: ribosome maturation factor RimM [Oscillospiraceae bacterium]|nr:ribosome maturation factor RimM [Clostridiales bacterium]MDY6095475.1 ribosome maturation factor RimM [Oscillospiraceae bacterium]
MKQQYLEAGKITNTHGVRGEVRITPWADSAAFLRGFRTFYIDGQPVRVLRSRVHKNQLIAQLEGYDDVNAAMTLKNKVIHIDRADAKLPEGRFFLQDLLGMRVVSDAGEALGELADVLDLPQGSVYVVRGTREILIPDVPEFLLNIDAERGEITVHLLEGM